MYLMDADEVSLGIDGHGASKCGENGGAWTWIPCVAPACPNPEPTCCVQLREASRPEHSRALSARFSVRIHHQRPCRQQRRSHHRVLDHGSPKDSVFRGVACQSGPRRGSTLMVATRRPPYGVSVKLRECEDVDDCEAANNHNEYSCSCCGQTLYLLAVNWCFRPDQREVPRPTLVLGVCPAPLPRPVPPPLAIGVVATCGRCRSRCAAASNSARDMHTKDCGSMAGVGKTCFPALVAIGSPPPRAL